MKNREMLLPALLSIALVFSLILTASAAGASATVHLPDEHSIIHSTVDSPSAALAMPLNTLQGQVTPMVAAGYFHTVGLESDGTVVAVGWNYYGQCNVGGLNEGTFTYREGTVVDLVAKAAEGCHFVNWNGDVDDIANVEDATTTITMNDDYSITANFVAVYNLSMAANPVGGGTAADETNGSPYTEGTVVSIKAEVNTGYRFVSWTAPAGTFGNTTAVETTFTMPAQDVTVTANFEPTPQLLIYEDDFSNPNSGWPQASSEDYEFSYEDGEYHILVKNVYCSAWALNWGAGPFTDFALEIDARLIDGPETSSYGVIFRVQRTEADNCYCFLVSGNGYYVIWTKTNDVLTVLQDWKKSSFIKEDNSTNHLKVLCEGSQIEVYVNGYHLATVTDDSFIDGYVGMVAYALGPDTRVAFDNIIVTIGKTGDMNNDGHVNALDMVLIGQHWGQTGSPGWIPEDVTKDGVINVLDMIIVGQHWTG